MAKQTTPTPEKNTVQQAPVLTPNPVEATPAAPAAADAPPAILEFNPVTLEAVKAIPELADCGLSGNCVLVRINPKRIVDVNTPEKLFEHSRAAWPKAMPDSKEFKHAVVMTTEIVEMDGPDGKAARESKTSVLAVYDVTEFRPFTEADVAEFKHRGRDSFCVYDRATKSNTDKLLEKRWMFSGTLNEKATRALKGLFWNKHVPMFWQIQGLTPEMLVKGCLSVLPPAKPEKTASTGTIRSFRVAQA